ncbi:MAG: single-stranded-DNA-specific exonuclease RecJ, partial [Gammaproteobacteria bacterium]|nr:single-stranded-DNA-specific exonuclease RecJ [Gammaproteobacteria bacterium]
TVDNGISSIAGVAEAKELGIKVLVTDHHLPGESLPNADTIVNPNQRGDEFPSKNLAGVGVIFYVMLALRTYLRQQNWFETQELKEPNLASVLDIVALGTVADVVPLDQNNRILVNQGLKRIRAGHACPGISALLEIANRNPTSIVASDLGFALGPRLNAAGRLEDMSIGIQCLLSENIIEARQYAQQLNQLNEERKQIERDMQSQALMDLETIHLEEETELPMGLCLYDPSWHQGVIGILASRIKDRFHRPVIVFAQDNESVIKGSARSIPNIHIRDVLEAVSTRDPDLIIKFGGHAMAAGLSIPLDKYEQFKQRFDEEVRRQMKPEYLDNIVYTDGELTQSDFDLTLAETLRNSEPWGQAFPEPMFDGIFRLQQQRIVGEKHLKLVLQPQNSSQAVDAIAFNALEYVEQGLTPGDQIRVAYKLDVNEFRGARNLQLMVEYIEQ